MTDASPPEGLPGDPPAGVDRLGSRRPWGDPPAGVDRLGSRRPWGDTPAGVDRLGSRRPWGDTPAGVDRLGSRRPWADTPAGSEPFVPQGRVITLPGRGETFVRVHTGPAGAPTVLLLHGWTATADLNWFATYRALAARMSLVAIDHRGHGRGLRGTRPFALEAAADDAAAALDVLGTGPAIAVGYSMGGPIALHLARRHPRSVDGLVLAGTALSFSSTRLARLQWVGLPLFGLGLRWDVERWLLRRILDEVGGSDELAAAWRDRLIGETLRGSARSAVEAGRALRSYDAEPLVAGLGVPATVVVTTADRLVRPRHQRRMAELLGAGVVELAGDHDVFVRDGAGFAAAILAAVEQTAQAGRGVPVLGPAASGRDAVAGAADVRPRRLLGGLRVSRAGAARPARRLRPARHRPARHRP